MNVFTVIGIIGIGIVVFTLLISFFMLRLSQLVTANVVELESEKNAYRPNQTLGFKIAPEADSERQFKEARLEAAKRAAALKRGANMGVGRLGHSNLRTASRNLENDPISSFKIASSQGWNGLGQFEALQTAATATTAVAGAAVAAAPVVKRKLVPGEDYPVIEITEGMDPVEIRKARIANAKAKSAAMKALKEAGADTVAAPTPAAAAAPAPTAAAAQPSAATLGIEEPTLIEITDDMDPADVRKARIANAKATSQYKKALKAAGASPTAAATPAPVEPAPAAPVAAAPAAPAAAPAGNIPEPDLIEITDDMDPTAIRQARIANAKAMSAYKKALKAAGIDPASVG